MIMWWEKVVVNLYYSFCYDKVHCGLSSVGQLNVFVS